MSNETQTKAANANRKYLAGWAVAETDHRRGMSVEGMAGVPQSSDDQDWAAGYRERAEQLAALDSMWAV